MELVGAIAILCSNDFLYALILENSIEIGDIHASSPIKKRKIHLLIPRKMVVAAEYLIFAKVSW